MTNFLFEPIKELKHGQPLSPQLSLNKGADGPQKFEYLIPTTQNRNEQSIAGHSTVNYTDISYVELSNVTTACKQIKSTRRSACILGVRLGSVSCQRSSCIWHGTSSPTSSGWSGAGSKSAERHLGQHIYLLGRFGWCWNRLRGTHSWRSWSMLQWREQRPSWSSRHLPVSPMSSHPRYCCRCPWAACWGTAVRWLRYWGSFGWVHRPQRSCKYKSHK